MGGLFGGDAPEYKAPAIDPGYEKQTIEASREMGEFDPAKYKAERMGKINLAKSLKGDLKNYGSTDPMVQKAIESKASKAFGEGTSAMQREGNLKAVSEQQSRIQRAHAYSSKINSIVSTMKARRMEEEANNMAIRSQVLSGLFQAGGSVAGFAAGGGFGGGSRDPQYQSNLPQNDPNFNPIG